MAKVLTACVLSFILASTLHLGMLGSFLLGMGTWTFVDYIWDKL